MLKKKNKQTNCKLVDHVIYWKSQNYTKHSLTMVFSKTVVIQNGNQYAKNMLLHFY